MMTWFRHIVLMILLLLAGRMAAQELPVLDSVCPGAERYYRVDGEAGSVYAWILTLPDATTEVLPSDADTLQMIWNYDPGTYILEARQYDENGCEAIPVYGEVIIFEAPGVFAGPDAEICADSYYSLIYATADYTTSVLWTTSGDGAFDDDDLLGATYIPGMNDLLGSVVTLTLTGYGLGDEGTCEPAVSYMYLTILPVLTPEFDPIGPLCLNTGPPALPGTSLNGISGTWIPDVINTSETGTFTFEFTPDEGECAVTTTIDIEVTDEIVPEFVPIGPLCQYTVAPALPAVSLNNISGTWEPDVISTATPGTFTFIFTPDEGQCAIAVPMDITVEEELTPVFEAIGPLCQNDAAPELPGTSLNGIPGTWDPDVISTSTPGTFTYTFTPQAGLCATIFTTDIVINAQPDVYAGEDQTIPYATSTFIGDATASGTLPLTYSWEPAALLIDPTVLNPTTVDLLVTTTFILTVTDGNGCESFDEVIINIEGGALAVDPSADPDEICMGATAQLFANASGGSGSYTYSWTSDPWGFVSDEENPVVSPMETTTYYIIVNDGYTTVTDSVMVIVNPLPEVYAGADQIIPYGTITTIGDAWATGAEPLTYSWTPATLLLDPTVLNPTTVNLDVTTTFTLTVVDANGCERSDEVTIFVNGEPLAVNPTAEPEEICLGSAVQLFANPTGGSGTYTFSWTSDPPGYTSDEENPMVSPSETTTYIVEVNDGYNTETGNVIVTVNPLPEVFAGADQIIPYGTSTTIGDAWASGAAPLTYSWTPAALLLDPTVMNPATVNLYATTTFTLTVVDGNGCESSDELIITISGEPLAVNPTAEPEVICLGSSAQLYANTTGGSGAYIFSWTSDPAGFTSGEENPLVSPLVTTTYYVEVNDGFNTVSGSVAVIVLPLPLVTCPDDLQVCEGDPSFALSGADPAGGTYSGYGVSNGVFDPAVAGIGAWEITYVYADENGCADTCAFTITITENPEVTQTNITNETESQQNGAIEIIATGSTPQLFYSINNGLNWQINNGLFENLSAGIYYCVVRDENGCDTSFVIVIHDIIITQLQAITGPGNHCAGNSVIIPLKVDNFISVASFQLKLHYNTDYLSCEGYINPHPQLEDNLTGLLDQLSGEITFNWQSETPLTFTQTETVVELVFNLKQAGLGQLDWYTGYEESYFADLEGIHIPAEFLSGQVMIYDPPQIFLSTQFNVCEGQPVHITAIAQGTNPPLSYLWTYPGGQTSTNEPSFDSVTMANAGDYTLLVTDALGCTDQKTVRLVVSENPVALFHDSDTLEVSPGYVLEAGSGLASYYWNTGETTENIVIDTAGQYWVEMMSLAGCFGIDSIYILLHPIKCLEMPNAFTPNGDGLNDIFEAVYNCPVKQFRMLIYNRWGEQLFESNDITVGWDGKKNGVLCPGDSYVYMVSYIVEESPGVVVKNVESGVMVLLR